MMLCTRRGAEFINDDFGPPPRSSQIPLPVQRLSIFLIFGARASKKVEHWRARLCGKQRKSTASVQGEGKRAWRARVRAASTQSRIGPGVLSQKLVVKVIALLPARSALTVTLSEVSNANEVEGSRTASINKIPRPFTCRIGQPALSEDPSPAQLRERASGAAVAYFCNCRDARVRVQRRLASRVGSIFSVNFELRNTSQLSVRAQPHPNRLRDRRPLRRQVKHRRRHSNERDNGARRKVKSDL